VDPSLTRDPAAAGVATEAHSPERTSTAFRNSNERLYEAYNDLHSLAQDFEKPFDAPAILVIGHQTDGKSGEAPRPRAAVSPPPLLASWLLTIQRLPDRDRGLATSEALAGIHSSLATARSSHQWQLSALILNAAR